METTPRPRQINLVVRDVERSAAFYRLLGWRVEPTGPHAAIIFDGFRVELDQHEFAEQWNSGAPAVGGGSAVLSVYVADRAGVDALVERVTAAGHRVVQKPYDAFWGSRFAIIADPDGYQIGLMSPEEEDRRFWPPRPAPR